MIDFFRRRSLSLSMVVLVLMGIVLLQSGISYSTTYGTLARFIGIPGVEHGTLPTAGLALRAAAILVVVVLWILNRRTALFKAVVAVNGLFTFGLTMNLAALVDVLFGLRPAAVRILLVDVVLMAISSILIFSIWYWIIDPPGVEELAHDDAAWEFLFPQRAGPLPHYEAWQPRYSDYLYLAFTTSFAFSPTDTLPLTRRAKMLMLLQSSISLITITAIAGSAINILAGGGGS
jgi:uncharacterized membrane protein